MSFSLCGTSLLNTGGIACDVSRAAIERLLAFNGSIAAADYVDSAAFMTKLTALSKLSKSNASKIFPFPTNQESADTSEANTEGTLGGGYKTVLREGLPSYTMKVFAGTRQLKALRSFNNKTIRIFEHDYAGNVWGTMSGTNFIGFQAKVFVTGGNAPAYGGSAVEEGVVTITVSILSASEYKDNAKYMPVGSDNNINNVVGLLDVNLAVVSNVSNVYKIKITTPTTQAGQVINIYDTFSTALASGVLWDAQTGVNYATDLAITSVAIDATLKAWTVTLDSTAYAALSSGAKIKLTLVAPETLAAADVTEIEADYVIITKP